MRIIRERGNWQRTDLLFRRMERRRRRRRDAPKNGGPQSSVQFQVVCVYTALSESIDASYVVLPTSGYHVVAHVEELDNRPTTTTNASYPAFSTNNKLNSLIPAPLFANNKMDDVSAQSCAFLV